MSATEWAPGDLALLERTWLPVAFEGDLGAPVGVTLLGRDLVVYRDADGCAIVAHDRCPHRGARLSAGALVGGELECPYHGWRYGAGGACTRVPSQPEDVALPPRASLAPLESASFGGIVWCRTAAEPGSGRLPRWPEVHDPTFRLVRAPAQRWETSAGRQVENFLDVSHFVLVHRGTFGGSGDPLVGDLDVTVSEDGSHLEQRFHFLASNPDGSPLGGATSVQRRMTYQVDLPYCSRLEICYDDGRSDVVLLASAPVTPTTCTVYVTVARNYDHDRPEHELLAWDLAILEEDRPVIESQRPRHLPLDLTDEVHVKADRATIAYRRALRAVGFERG